MAANPALLVSPGDLVRPDVDDGPNLTILSGFGSQHDPNAPRSTNRPIIALDPFQVKRWPSGIFDEVEERTIRRALILCRKLSVSLLERGIDAQSRHRPSALEAVEIPF
jgi:hypothetical protein